MSEEASRIPAPEEKHRSYEDVEQKARGLLGGEVDQVARMAGLVALLHGAMPHFYWTGFYRVVGAELVIGPYQGTPGCGRIGWGRGVCGTAWKTGEPQVVADVHDFPGHIACDARSRSEVVVPVLDAAGRVIAVLDVDSDLPGAFDVADAVALERLVAMFISPAAGLC